jgi:hypothetical protein
MSTSISAAQVAAKSVPGQQLQLPFLSVQDCADGRGNPSTSRLAYSWASPTIATGTGRASMLPVPLSLSHNTFISTAKASPELSGWHNPMPTVASGHCAPELHSHVSSAAAASGLIGMPGRTHLIRGASTMLTGLVLPERPGYHPLAARTCNQDQPGAWTATAADSATAMSSSLCRVSSTGPLLSEANGELHSGQKGQQHHVQWAAKMRLPQHQPWQLQGALPDVCESRSLQLAQLPGGIGCQAAAALPPSALQLGCLSASGLDTLPDGLVLESVASQAFSVSQQQLLLCKPCLLQHGVAPVGGTSGSAAGAAAAGGVACSVREARESVGTLAQFLARQLSGGSAAAAGPLNNEQIGAASAFPGAHQGSAPSVAGAPRTSSEQAAVTSVSTEVASSSSAAALVPTEPASISEATIAARPNFEARQRPPASY